MSRRKYRRFTASALLAGCLGLLPLVAEAAPAPHHADSRRAATASPSLFSSFWSLLVNLWAGDQNGGNTGNPGNPNSPGNPVTDPHPPNPHEGPGMCPHGHNG
jgi:hypothetical protein